MKTTLIFLSTLAGILGVFTFFAIFGSSSGTYAVSPLASGNNATSAVFIVSSSTPSSSISLTNATSTDQSSDSSTPGFYGSVFTVSALSWTDGGAKFSIMAVALQNKQLSFTFTIQMGGSPACVPTDLRLVADEAGNLQGPTTPSFSFPDSGNCNGSPNETYNNQTLSFNVDPANLPFLFTTGGTANIFFEIATTTANGLEVDLPGTSG